MKVRTPFTPGSAFAPDAFVLDWVIPGDYDIVTPVAVESPTWSI